MGPSMLGLSMVGLPSEGLLICSELSRSLSVLQKFRYESPVLLVHSYERACNLSARGPQSSSRILASSESTSNILGTDTLKRDRSIECVVRKLTMPESAVLAFQIRSESQGIIRPNRLSLTGHSGVNGNMVFSLQQRKPLQRGENGPG